jgi:uncharacterized membrane protein
MPPSIIEILDLVARWVHVIAAIMWVGNSLLFNWLDRNLRPSSRGGEGMQGEIWLLHSGGFYFVEKTQLAGQPVPRPLHWFMWQAYTTWISGVVLLVAVYYVGGRALMVDPAAGVLRPRSAVWVGLGTIFGGRILYDLYWQGIAKRSAAAAGALSIASLVGVVYMLTHLLTGRAAFLHVGAMLGTIMAGNVATSIVPSQRALVAAVEQGRRPDPKLAERAKTVSIHNNYLTFPVIILMLSSHFPAVYGHPLNWLLLLILLAAGASVRHVMNVRFTYRHWVPALATVVLVGLIPLYLLLQRGASRDGGPRTAAAMSLPDAVTFAEARVVIDRRCAACHSREPSDVSLGLTPAGVAFDTPEQIRALAPRIHERAVVTRTMPPANKTRITDRERALLGRWVEQGAR